VKGKNGYASADPGDRMLSNLNFVDAKLELLVRSGSSSWMKTGDYPVERKLTAPALTERHLFGIVGRTWRDGCASCCVTTAVARPQSAPESPSSSPPPR
jgi:hypothetical protein